MSTEDEEALAWAGDNEERLTTGSTSKSPVRKRRASPSSTPSPAPSPAISAVPDVEPAAASASASASAPVAESWVPSEAFPEEEEEARGGLSSGQGILMGVLGGFYLLFSAAWIVTALRNPVQISDPLGSFMFVTGLWMAAFAPAAWFSATLVLGRHRSFLWRFAILALGAVVVIPWPYFSWAA
jgi:hypothetical protein